MPRVDHSGSEFGARGVLLWEDDFGAGEELGTGPGGGKGVVG